MNRYPTYEQVMNMTAQDMFNHAAGHLLTQGRRSTRPTSRMCLYRDHTGGACGVGALIPEALYREDMEQRQSSDLIHFCWSLGGVYTAFAQKLHAHRDLLKAIQRTHDELDPSQWRAALRQIARIHRLYDDVLALFPEPRDGFERVIVDDFKTVSVKDFFSVSPFPEQVKLPAPDAKLEARRQYERMIAALKGAPPFVGIATSEQAVTHEFA
jgi:hypothetical protein